MTGLTSFSLSFGGLQAQENTFLTGEGTVVGLDILLKKRWRKYTSWFSYTLSDIQYSFDGLNNGQSFAASHDHRHNLSWMHLFKLNQFEISVGWNFRTGLPYTDVIDIEEFTDGTAVNYNLVYGATNAERLPNYHRLDVSFLYQFESKSNQWNGTIGLSFFNLYNRSNVANTNFFIGYPDVNDNELILYQQDRTLLDFTPNVMIKLVW